MERIKKRQAIENAHHVASWTKKVMIQRQIYENEPLLASNVWIKNVRKPGGKDTNDSSENISEYALQEDSDWEFPRDLLELGSDLGEGTFGKVIQGWAHCTAVKEETLNMEGNIETVTTGGQLVIMPSVKEPALVAVKMLKEGNTDQDMIDFVKEMEIMKMIGKHVNIINLLGVCTQPIGQPLLVIVEYAGHGNLRDFLRARRPELVQYLGRQGDRHVSLRNMLSFGLQVIHGSLKYHLLLTYPMFQAARGMEFLHSCKCVHRDLVARNVLVGHEGVVKIADFGMVRDLSECDYYRKVGEGNLSVKWMSPESLFKRVFTPMVR
jgi:serine/threonine protein kinase